MRFSVVQSLNSSSHSQRENGLISFFFFESTSNLQFVSKFTFVFIDITLIRFILKMNEPDFVYIAILGVGDIFSCSALCVNYIRRKNAAIVELWNCGTNRIICIILKKINLLVNKFNCMNGLDKVLLLIILWKEYIFAIQVYCSEHFVAKKKSCLNLLYILKSCAWWLLFQSRVFVCTCDFVVCCPIFLQ